MGGAIHGLRDFERLAAGPGSGAMIAHVQIHQDVDLPVRGAGGFLIPLDLKKMIHHHHRAGLGNSRNLKRIGNRRGQQEPRDPGSGHQLGFSQRRYADTASTGRELPPGDLDALVRLGVRAQGLPAFLDALRHPRQVGLKQIEIQQQRGSQDVQREALF